MQSSICATAYRRRLLDYGPLVAQQHRSSEEHQTYVSVYRVRVVRGEEIVPRVDQFCARPLQGGATPPTEPTHHTRYTSAPSRKQASRSPFDPQELHRLSRRGTRCGAAPVARVISERLQHAYDGPAQESLAARRRCEVDECAWLAAARYSCGGGWIGWSRHATRD